MTSKEYWELRQFLFDKRVNINLHQLEQAYKSAFNSIKVELENLYTEITTEEVINSTRHSYNRLYSLMNKINQEIIKLGGQEIDINTSSFKRVYEENMALIFNETGFEPIIDSNRLETAIKAIWCGDHIGWSERVWKDKTLLENSIRQLLTQSVIQGKPLKYSIDILQQTFGTSLYNASRIVRTETNYIMNKSSLDRYKEVGCKYYQVLSDQAIDSCLDEDGNIFPIDQAIVGETAPPFHPNCRCVVVPYMPGFIDDIKTIRDDDLQLDED